MNPVSIPNVYLILIGGGRDKPSHHFVPTANIPATLLERMEVSKEKDRVDWWGLLRDEVGEYTSVTEVEKVTEALHDRVMVNELKGDVLAHVLDTYAFSS